MILLLIALGCASPDKDAPSDSDGDSDPTPDSDPPVTPDPPEDTALQPADSDLPVFLDEDGDGFAWDVDCDDEDGAVFPGADDPCDDVDQDCDGDAGQGAWFWPAIGPAEDLTAAFSLSDAVPWQSPQPGALHLCPGTWRAPLHLRHGVDVTGHDGRAAVVLSPNGRRGVTVEPDLAVTLTGFTVFNATELEAGGGVWLGERTLASLSDLTLDDCVAADGAGLYASDDARVELRGVRVSRSFAEGEGGAVYVGAGVTFVASDLELEDNTANIAGGLYAREAASLDLERVAWRRNHASRSASDLVVTGGGPVRVAGYELQPHPVLEGGAIDVHDAGAVEIIDPVGPVAGYSAPLQFRSCASLRLGAVTISGATGAALSLELLDAVVEGLVAEDNPSAEAVVSVDHADVVFESCRFERNASRSGTLEASGTVTLRDCRFADNTATVGSGGIGSNGTLDLVVERSVFDGNTGWSGAAIRLSAGTVRATDVEFTDNHADRWGGAMSTFDTEVVLERVTASGNEAALYDGGFARFAEDSVVTIVDSRFEGGAASDGGAFAVQGALSLTDVTLEGHEARSGLGGAVWLTRDEATLTFVRVDFGVGVWGNTPHDVGSGGVGFDLGLGASGACDGAGGCL